MHLNGTHLGQKAVKSWLFEVLVGFRKPERVPSIYTLKAKPHAGHTVALRTVNMQSEQYILP